MAISDVVGRVYSALLLEGISSATAFASLAQDRSGEIVDSGNGLRVPLGQSSVTIRDYVKGTPITLETLAPTHADIDLNIQKYFAANIEEIDESQTRFSLLMDAAGAGSRSLAAQLATSFRSVIAGVDYAANKTSIDLTPVADTLTDAEIKLLHGAILDVIGALRSEGQTSSPFLVLPREVWKQLVLFYSSRTGTLPATSPEGSVFRDATLSALFGADILVDYNDGQTTALPFNLYAGIPQRTYAWARQVSNTERLRSQEQFSTILRGLLTYGIAVQESDSAYRINLTKAS